MWAYNLMVNNIVRSKYIFVENYIFNITINYIFTLSIFKVIFIYKKLDKILKPINRQLKFIKEDKRLFATLNHLS